MADVIDLMTYKAKITLDDKGFSSALDQAEMQFGGFKSKMDKLGGEIGKSVAGGFSAVADTVDIAAKGLMAYSTAAIGAATAIGTAAVKSYGELEQNLGGSEAVFGQYAASIQKTGEEAYKNLGISQSEYLATANKMGALFQGSGIEQQKSLELTEKAMQRAADMASVMGIDMSAAMEAVTGAAKGNFTMMDNLGVAMNATTLQAYATSKGLVAVSAGAGAAKVDAEKLASAQDRAATAALSVTAAQERYNSAVAKNGADSTQARQAAISLEKAQIALASAGRKVESAMTPASAAMGDWWKSASQADKAELAMQMFLENTQQYAGNFAKEATQTISGSIGLLKSSVSSLVAGLGNSNANIQNLAGNVVEAFGATMENILPIVENVANAMPEVIDTISSAAGELIPKVTSTLVSKLPTIATSFLKGFNSVILNVVGALSQSLPTMIDTLLPALLIGFFGLVSGLVDAMPSLLPTVVSGAISLFTGLTDGLSEVIPQLLGMLPELIDNIGNTLIDNLPTIIESGFQILISLIQGLTNAIPNLITKVAEMIPVIVGALTSPTGIKALITAGIDLIVALAKGLPQAIPAVVAAIPTIITAIICAFMTQDWAQIGIDIMLGIGGGIIEGVKALAETIKEAAKSVLKSAKSAFGIHSPSVLFRDEVGKYLAEGIGVGFENQMVKVNRQMYNAVTLDYANSSVGRANSKESTVQASGVMSSPINIQMGDIIIHGNADRKTVEDIESAVKKQFSGMISDVQRVARVHRPVTGR